MHGTDRQTDRRTKCSPSSNKCKCTLAARRRSSNAESAASGSRSAETAACSVCYFGDF